MWKLVVPVLILALMVIGVVLADKPVPRADFRFINRGDVSTLDLAQMSWMQDFRVARFIYEGLTRNDIFSAGYDPVPAVAERWEVSSDGRTYTFFLRDSARWSNGDQVRAGHFVYAWRRLLLPDSVGDYAKLFTLIKGGEAFYQWRADKLREFAADTTIVDRASAAEALWKETLAHFDATVGVRAIDDRTLVVELERPTPYFMSLTSFGCFAPVYPPLVRAHESIDASTGLIRTRSDWTKPPALVTNGPFMLTIWRFKRDMYFERNPHYWDAAAIDIDTISIPSIQDGNAQVLAFQTGAVDWISDVTPSYGADMVAAKRAYYQEHKELHESLMAQNLDPVEIDRRMPPDPRQNVHTFPAFGTYFYNFYCQPTLLDGRPNPFADARVRKAFAMALDRDNIVSNIRRNGEKPATTLIPRDSIAGYTSPKGLPYDPAAARALLAEAGFPGGKGLPTIEIIFNKEGGHDIIAQSVAKDWERNLGVDISLGMKEIKVFREDLKGGNFMVSRAAWFGDYGDPTTFLDLHRSFEQPGKDGQPATITFDGNNDRKFHSPRYNALLNQARDQADPARRMALLSEAERIIVEEEVPLVPIFQYVQIYLFDPHKLTGISPHPRQEQAMHLIDVLGDGKGSDEPKTMQRWPIGPVSK
jgi:oligopeptide transport system substrate-binding protein